jgi:metal-dependent HD superfamily phosphatase/phosphodiesterase
MVTFEDVQNSPEVRELIKNAQKQLDVLGYTEHSHRHVSVVAERAANILRTLGCDEHRIELAKIAGYMHDIGNVINRVDHSQSGAVMAFRILDRMEFPPEEIACIISAIGNHDEGSGVPVNPVAAALIIADKSDVRRSRVRDKDSIRSDIHDRVNYSVTSSKLTICEDQKVLELSLTVDTTVSSVMEYFEIFMNRMLMCRKASNCLGLQFQLNINGQQLI